MTLKEISHGTISPSELSAVPPPFRLIGLMRRGHRDGAVVGTWAGRESGQLARPNQPTYGNVFGPCLPLAGRSLALTIFLIESYARERAGERERERSCRLEVTSAAAALLSNDEAVSVNASRRRFKTVATKTSQGFHFGRAVMPKRKFYDYQRILSKLSC